MPTVQVEGLGRVSFPDGTSEADMTSSVKEALLQKNAPAPLSGPIGSAPPDLITGNHEAMNRSSLMEGLKGTVKRAVGNSNVLGHVLAGPQGSFFGSTDPQFNTASSNPDQTAGEVAEGVGEMALPGIVGKETAINALPNAERAGAVLRRIAEEAKDVRVPLTQGAEALGRVMELGGRGATAPNAATALSNRTLGLADPQFNMTFPEARDYYSNISRLSGDEANKINPVMKKAVGALRDSFHGDLTNAADTIGMGKQYENAVKEYRHAAQLGKVGSAVLGKVADTLPYAGLGAAGYKLFH